ncbi:MAG: type II toxin-antitoxin system YafQ family toxin [Candidatus Methanomethylophilaceae archaeon]|nr:type II toxin-antitoxin system YafQ family toxin [Candidatus Methanomethylophilaceae archaeon]
MTRFFLFLHGKKEPVDYEEEAPCYLDRRSRRAVREAEEYERGERDFDSYAPIGSRNVIGDKDYLYDVVQTSAFKKDLEMMKKRGADLSLLDRAIDILGNGGALPPSYRNHPLRDDLERKKKCHIGPDLLFIYSIDQNQLKLIAIRT